MNYETIKNNRGAVLNLYERMTNDIPLENDLLLMQEAKGIQGQEAKLNNRQLLEQVARFYSSQPIIREDAAAAFEMFLQYSKALQGYDRKVLLHQLFFGLKLYQNAELAQKMLDGADLDTLFREYYAECGEDPAITVEVLERDIRRLVSQYRISPAAMRLFVRKLENGEDFLATSAALGEEGYHLKCLAAMELYLKDPGKLTMEEAVADACTGIDAQAAADAYSTGILTGDVAEKLLKIFTLVLALQGAYYFLAGPLKTPTVHATLQEFHGFMENPENLVEAMRAYAASRNPRIKQDHMVGFKFLMGSLATWSVSENVAHMAGRLSTKASYTIRAKESLAAQAMKNLAQTQEAKTSETVAQRDVWVMEEQKNEQTHKREARQQQKVFG